MKTLRTIQLNLVWLIGLISCTASEKQNHLAGEELYQSVEKYVSFGEHRTATPVDNATVEWLSGELSAFGYEVKFTEFPLKQFFHESSSVTAPESHLALEAFPLWYLNDTISLNVSGILTTETTKLDEVDGKIVLLNFAFGQQGQSAVQIRQKLTELSQAGARGIVGYNENKAEEIVAFNAPKAGTPWPIPIVVISPRDAARLSALTGQNVGISIEGKFEDVVAKNLYGTIGTGQEYIVVSTPISGWFACGGERGPGVAVWLGLAKWASTQNLPYTFVFTGNSGHELGFWGADEFLEHDAPPVDQTKLWIHLGAGLATLAWESTPSGLVKQNEVDGNRNFFYTAPIKSEFDRAFQDISGKKWDTRERNGGELIHVVDKGYKNALGVSYAHPYFHAKNDSASNTSPEILEEVALSFRNFIVEIAN